MIVICFYIYGWQEMFASENNPFDFAVQSFHQRCFTLQGSQSKVPLKPGLIDSIPNKLCESHCAIRITGRRG